MLDRIDRIAKLMKREISSILHEEINDPRIRRVTITHIEISRDIRTAKAFYTVSDDESERRDIAKGLKSATSFIRRELTERIAMKFSPKITFIEDSSRKEVESIDYLFDRIVQERKRNDDVEKGEPIVDIDNMQKVVEAFKELDNFLITAHVNPEGDSIGSQLAVYYILRKMGKYVVMVNHDDVPENLKFLPGAGLITHEIPESIQLDNVIILDCPVKERTGNVCKLFNDDQLIINIDHHVSNELFGAINWVEPNASSVGEMVFHLIKELDSDIEKDVSTAIYTAILTDTGMFNYDNTSSGTHKVVAELLKSGVNPKEVHEEIFEKKSVAEIKLLGKALTTLQLECGGKVVHLTLTKRMYEEENVDYVSTDEFINFPRSIKGVEAAIFFKESVNAVDKINVSFRSTGNVDVNTIASHFGGGGHPRASGCVLDYNLEEAKEIVLAEVKRMLEV